MDVATILSQFDVGAPMGEAVAVSMGHIHRTYKVTTERGSFVLQQLHDVISDAAISDMHAVAAYVSQHGILAPVLERATSGSFVARDTAGARWRLYPWIDGVVVDRVTNVAMAHEAGRILGALHRRLAQFKYAPVGSIPHFHDTAYVLAELQKAAPSLPAEIAPIARSILDSLPGLIVGVEAGPAQLIHGDPKISNLVFSPDGQAVGVIDFDTILTHYRTIDIGDALRSWCNHTVEDSSVATFSVEFFDAAVTGYGQGKADSKTRALYLRAAKHIALELCARFAADIVNDNYFSWDQERYPSRRAHNTARALGQYHLAESIPSV